MSTPSAIPEDVAWLQGGVTVYIVDMSQPAVSVPKYIARYRSYSFDEQWTGSPQGVLSLQVLNAGESNGSPKFGIVGPIWVPVDDATLVVGSGSFPATNPSSQGEDVVTHAWCQVVWTPTTTGSNAGNMMATFGGGLR